MPHFLESIGQGNQLAIGPRQTRLTFLIDQLESGISHTELLQSEFLTAKDLICVLAIAGLGPENTPTLPLKRSSPPRPRLQPAIRSLVDDFWNRSQRTNCLILEAGLFQIFDFWEESHEAAQEADDREDRTGLGSLWHAIAHRREPDPGNSAYWYRRAGRDPFGIFDTMAAPAQDLMTRAGKSSWVSLLLKDGRWTPLAFIEICNQITPRSSDETLARQLQRLEMIVTLEASMTSAEA